MRRRLHLPSEVAERLGPYYVYALVDPENDHIFYVGKGSGQRLMAHGREADLTVDATSRSLKVREIRRIRETGNEPRIDIVRHGLSEGQALLVEAALIDVLPGLMNKVVGHGADVGCAPLEEYAVQYGAAPVPESAPAAVLVRITGWKDSPEEIEPGVYRDGNGFRPGMTEQDLVNSTRAWWRMSPKTVERRNIHHAVAVHEGVTRAVMEIGDWIRRNDGRWAFAATPLGGGEVFDAWVGPLGRRVEFTKAAQNPITYWPRNAGP